LEILKVSVLSEDEEKNQPQSTRRPQSIFFQKTKNMGHRSLSHPLCVLPDLCGLCLFSFWEKNLSTPGFFMDEDQRKNEEAAESAEVF